MDIMGVRIPHRRGVFLYRERVLSNFAHGNSAVTKKKNVEPY